MNRDSATSDDESASISMVPSYTFEWDDGTTRTTDDLPPLPERINRLAELGAADPECEVTLDGFRG